MPYNDSIYENGAFRTVLSRGIAMQKKSFQELAATFNTLTSVSTGNQDKMAHLSLRYAILSRHKWDGEDDATRTALAHTMLDTALTFINNVFDYIIEKDRLGEKASPETVYGWIEAPLTAMVSPEAIAYLPKDTPDRLAELALKGIDDMAGKPADYKFHKDAYATMALAVQSILTHADMVADHVKANELTPDHLKTKQPITARKPIMLRSRAATPAA